MAWWDWRGKTWILHHIFIKFNLFVREGSECYVRHDLLGWRMDEDGRIFDRGHDGEKFYLYQVKAQNNFYFNLSTKVSFYERESYYIYLITHTLRVR